MATSGAVHAENNCPWMNEATASDLVGLNAVGSYRVDQDKSEICTFTEQSKGVERTLEIIVESTSNAHDHYLLSLQKFCHSAKEPLNAAGNEASICSIMRRKSITGERAIGRVRNQVFMISMNTSVRNDPILTPAMLVMKISMASEEVAGNLF